MKKKAIFNSYLKGKLDSNSKIKLEQKLEEDIELANEFLLFKLEQYYNNELPDKYAHELEKEIISSPKLKRYLTQTTIEQYLNGLMSEENELAFEEELKTNIELKEEFDFCRIERYLNNELIDRHLIEFELDLDNNAELAQKLEFTEEIERLSNEKLDDSSPLDYIAFDINYEEKFMRAMDEAIEDYKKEQEKKTPKQKNWEKLDILRNLEEVERETKIDFNDLNEVEVHNNIMQGISNELGKIKMEVLLEDIEKGKMYSPHKKDTFERVTYRESALHDSIAHISSADTINWFSKKTNKPWKRLLFAASAIAAITLSLIFIFS